MKNKKIIIGVFSFVLILGVAFVGAKTYASSLTSSQVQAIVSLLQAFGVDTNTITNVQAVLTGQTGEAVAPTSTSVNTLIPSDTFVNFTVMQGTSNPPPYNLHLTNGSSAAINYTLSVPSQPSWLNTGYATQTLTLGPGEVAGVGVSVDATQVDSPGTYTTNLVVKGNFTGSPINIPITLNVTATSTVQPSIAVAYPQAGNILDNSGGKDSGLIANIQWSSVNVGDNTIGVALTNASGNTIKYIANGLQNTGSYGWKYDSSIPNGTYQVEVYVDSVKGGFGQEGWSGAFTLTGNNSVVTPPVPVAACSGQTTDVVEAALGNPGGTGPFEQLQLATSTHPEILQYRIQWFGGSWSQWYVPGVNDLDTTKVNIDGTQRRMWAYFDDHTHEYIKCLSAVTVTPGTPVISGVSGPQSLGIGRTGTWNVNASDPSGSSLTYSVKWGDEQPCTGGVYCVAVVPTQQTGTFTHSYSRTGTFAPIFTVFNSSGKTAQTSLTVNVAGTATSTVQPSISVSYPAGGETFTPGQQVTIRYSANNFPRAVNVEFQLNKGAAYPSGPYNPINNSGSYVPASGTYTYTLPGNLVAGNDYSFLISSDYPTTETSGGNSGYSNNFSVVSLASPSMCLSTTTITEGALGNPGGTGPFEQLQLATSTHPEILQYRIQWFGGSWSQWYTPGIGDTDSVLNMNGTQRRMWAYFDDHTHQYVKCLSTSASSI